MTYSAIGGFTFLRLEYDMLSQGDAASFQLTSPNFVNLYFDARPSERVRGYLSSRALYNPAIPPAIPNDRPSPTTLVPMQQTMLLLDQLWLKFDLGQVAYFTVGRQRVRWGVGRFLESHRFSESLSPGPAGDF